MAQDTAIFTGKINAWQLNVRKRPSQHAAVIGVLSKGDTIRIIGKTGGIGHWLEISFNGNRGFIRNRPKYVTLTKTVKTRKEKQKINKQQITGTKSITSENEYRQKQTIKQQIKQEREKIASFSQKEVSIIDGLNEIDASLNRARRKAAGISEQINEIEETIADILKKRVSIAKEFKQNQAYAGTRLNALYRMKMLGKLGISAEPDSLFDFIINQKAMERIIAADLKVMKDQIRSLIEFGKLERQLKEKREEKISLEKDLKQQILTKERESEKKNAILKEIKQKKKLAQAAVASLKAAEIKLDQQIESIKQKKVDTLITGSIVNYKGRLEMPVKGKIISQFGANRTGDYKSFTFQSGIDISVERGEPVRAVFQGEVLFAQWFKGYGNLMIINHGDNYYTLYAHVEEFFKKKGDQVEKGEVIATAGDTGSIKGLCLHFEIRHHGKPVNPKNWLRKGA